MEEDDMRQGDAERLVAAVEDDRAPQGTAVRADAIREQEAMRELLRALATENDAVDVVADVMARLESALPWHVRLQRALFAPHRVTLRWNLATVGGIAVLIAMAVAGITRWRQAPDVAATDPVVTFVFVAPEARSVTVAGDFNGWQATAAPLRDEDRDGVWTLTLPLRPGRYEYMFVVDGTTWRTDPLARLHRPDGFGRENAVLDL